MPRRNVSSSSPVDQTLNWFNGKWYNLLKICVPILISIIVGSFLLGKYYADLTFQYEKLKMQGDCSDRLNQEIDKNRDLHDQINKKDIDDLKTFTNQIKGRLK